MPKIAAEIELDVSQIRKAIGQLKLKEKIGLAEELDKETWQARFEELVSRIRKRAKRTSITETDIIDACERVRQRLYNERISGHN